MLSRQPLGVVSHLFDQHRQRARAVVPIGLSPNRNGLRGGVVLVMEIPKRGRQFSDLGVRDQHVVDLAPDHPLEVHPDHVSSNRALDPTAPSRYFGVDTSRHAGDRIAP